MDLNFGIAFFFGVISFFSPCVLPLVPGYLAIFSLNKNDQISRIIGSLQFVLGFSFVFVSLGALATTLGSFFSRNATILSQVSGFIIIFFGLILLIPKLNTRYFYGSNLLNIDKELINLKGKTVEKLGLIGKEKAIACEVICSITQ